MRRFLMGAKGHTVEQAISLMSFMANFGIMQKVSGHSGVLGVVEKRVIVGDIDCSNEGEDTS